MIDIQKDKKSDCFIITKTDSEGFHKQITLTWEEMTKIADYVSAKGLNDILHNNL